MYAFPGLWQKALVLIIIKQIKTNFKNEKLTISQVAIYLGLQFYQHDSHIYSRKMQKWGKKWSTELICGPD